MGQVAMTGVLVAAAAGFAGGAGEPTPDAEAIRGTWRVVSATQTRGLEPTADVPEYIGSTWAFAGGRLTIRKGAAEMVLAYALDEGKSPRQIDLGKHLKGKGEDRPAEGIYELRGDRLRVCYTEFNPRPTDFGMGRGIAAIKVLVVLERVK